MAAARYSTLAGPRAASGSRPEEKRPGQGQPSPLSGPRAGAEAQPQTRSRRPSRVDPQLRRTFPAASRLKKPREFAAVIEGSRQGGWRATQRWLAATGRWRSEDAAQTQDGTAATSNPLQSPESPAPRGPIRFGFTVGKRFERRSVMRALVKRILREACRQALPTLVAAAPGARIDVVLRLKAPLPTRAEMGLAQLKRELREQADALLAQLRRALT